MIRSAIYEFISILLGLMVGWVLFVILWGVLGG